jgi:NAD(P)-dependent dehydrogenase (short-subunit alcohol dehydrogenase family)
VADEIKSFDGQALVIPCDIMVATAIENTVQKIISTWGRLDIVVANAGFGVFGSIEKLTAKDWNRQLQGNVTGLALTIKYALPHLKKPREKLV